MTAQIGNQNIESEIMVEEIADHEHGFRRTLIAMKEHGGLSVGSGAHSHRAWSRSPSAFNRTISCSNPLLRMLSSHSVV